MAQRSQFLALLDQSGWSQAELAPENGSSRAFLTRRGEQVEIEIREGSQMLCRLMGRGRGARLVMSGLVAVEGVYVDLSGQEAAWTRSVEALFAMRASTMSVESEPYGGPKIAGSIKITGLPAKPSDGGGP